MKTLLLIASALLLTACAQPAPRLDSGNDRSVVLTRTFDRGAAFQMADAHCHNYGRKAQLRQTVDFIMVFDCVE